MKSLFISSFVLLCAFSIQAQTTCEKLTAAYSAEELNKIENPDYLCFIATQGYLVNDMSDKDLSGYPDISTLAPRKSGVAALSGENFDLGTFNILNYNFELKETSPTVYKIGDTGQTLFIQSKVRMEVMYQRYQANQNATK